MTTMHFLVEVEVERTSGLFAARNDIEEAISSALWEAPEQADLSGIGPNGDSVYEASRIDVTVLDAKGLKALRDEYDSRVEADRPTASEAEQKLREARAEITRLTTALASAEALIAANAAEQEAAATGVWTREYIGGKPVRRVVSGGRSGVEFDLPQEGADEPSVARVTVKPGGVLEVYGDRAWIMQASNSNVLNLTPSTEY